MRSLVLAADNYLGAGLSTAAARCCRQVQLLAVQIKRPNEKVVGLDSAQAIQAAARLKDFADSHALLSASGEPRGVAVRPSCALC